MYFIVHRWDEGVRVFHGPAEPEVVEEWCRAHGYTWVGSCSDFAPAASGGTDGAWDHLMYTLPPPGTQSTLSRSRAPQQALPSVLRLELFDGPVAEGAPEHWLRAAMDAGYKPILVDDSAVYCVREEGAEDALPGPCRDGVSQPEGLR
ncbi:MAG: hypothetical protein K6T81_03440 [Alicyclobacillus macrosporangiidus]|uniref:hypothetical protein n=1 Tax=Alicyclobacillus macrosporangiidus TaxID=392015 RepID=UPI0026EC679B|nr:hypothetical protein [Alicyclobacillus macrosporangiidus]MCL6597776.1 hypothetical protein [Alicyclobacillus macrosporangiidus]